MNTIKKVIYLDNYKLRIYFADGHVNDFDYESLVTSGHEEFSKYLNILLFKQFQIVNNNTAVAWGNDWEMILPASTLRSKKSVRVKRLFKPKILSVTQYAKKMNVQRQAVLSQIKQKRLPSNIIAKKVGYTWMLSEK